MNPRSSTLHAQLSIFTPLMDKLFDELQPEQLSAKISDNTSSLQWLLGHLINSRNGICVLLGKGVELPGFAEHFGRGSSGTVSADGPGLEELRQAWKTVSATMLDAVEAADDAQLDAEPCIQPPFPLPSTFAFVALLTQHDAYHIGQVALMTKAEFDRSFIGR